MLTQRQLQLLEFIKAHVASDGVAPTYREMAAGIGTSSLNTVRDLLIRLEERGFIRRLPHRRQAIEVLK